MRWKAALCAGVLTTGILGQAVFPMRGAANESANSVSATSVSAGVESAFAVASGTATAPASKVLSCKTGYHLVLSSKPASKGQASFTCQKTSTLDHRSPECASGYALAVSPGADHCQKVESSVPTCASGSLSVNTKSDTCSSKSVKPACKNGYTLTVDYKAKNDLCLKVTTASPTCLAGYSLSKDTKSKADSCVAGESLLFVQPAVK